MEDYKEPENFDTNDDDLYEHHRFVASSGQEPLRVDKFLMNFVENAILCINIYLGFILIPILVTNQKRL